MTKSIQTGTPVANMPRIIGDTGAWQTKGVMSFGGHQYTEVIQNALVKLDAHTANRNQLRRASADLATVTYTPPGQKKPLWSHQFAYGDRAVHVRGFTPRTEFKRRYTPEYVGVQFAIMASKMMRKAGLKDTEVYGVILHAPIDINQTQTIKNCVYGTWGVEIRGESTRMVLNRVTSMEEVVGGINNVLVNGESTGHVRENPFLRWAAGAERPQDLHAFVVDLGGRTTEVGHIIGTKPQFDSFHTLSGMAGNGTIGFNDIIVKFREFVKDIWPNETAGWNPTDEDISWAMQTGHLERPDTGFVFPDQDWWRDKSGAIFPADQDTPQKDIQPGLITLSDDAAYVLLDNIMSSYERMNGANMNLVALTGGGALWLRHRLAERMGRPSDHMVLMGDDENAHMYNPLGAAKLIELTINKGLLK